MISLNDDNIIIGEIKELLQEFNLPNITIEKTNRSTSNKQQDAHYIKNNNMYLYKKIREYAPETAYKYIKDYKGNTLVGLKDNSYNLYDLKEKKHYKLTANYEDILTESYTYGEYYKNITTNLKINNTIYDRDTHRYLGKYLRFLRDYANVNLMSMYNCFDYETININLKFSVNSSNKLFSSDDLSDCYIYSVPVDNEDYSIFFKSPNTFETCLTVLNYTDMYEKDSFLSDLAKLTYQKLNLSLTGKQYLGNLFDLAGDAYKDTLINYKENVRLLLKIPKTMNLPIVLLEGDFVSSDKYNSNPQLVNYTNNKQYLLADKIIEYLTDNAITPMSNSYEIQKLQQLLTKVDKEYSFRYFGIWGGEETEALQRIILNDKLNEDNFDILCYCDSVVEKQLNSLIKGVILI